MVLKAVSRLFGQKSREVSNDSAQAVDLAFPSRSGKDRNRTIQLVIGLDFGTSFTKVIVAEPRVRYAVPFDAYGVGGRPELLPSALCVPSDTDVCHLGIDPQDGTLYDNLKMPLIERDFSHEVQARAAAYLALVLRHTRQWLFDAHGSVYESRNVEWFVNTGLPTDSYDDEQLTSTYLAIVRTAWRASVLPGGVTLPSVVELLKEDDANPSELVQASAELELPRDRVNAFPEFCAQLAGYVRSPRRRDGLHVTVDVGGGTLDVTVFNVHAWNGEDVFPIFARQVEPLGVRYLAQARHRALSTDANSDESPFDNLPPDAAFMQLFGCTKAQLKAADHPFRSKIAGAITETLRYTRQDRYPRAPQWDPPSSRYGEPLPGFFCGGGALADFYADLLHGFEQRNPPYRLRASEFPVPDDLEPPGLTSKDYARLAVAYGLSFDPYDMGQIRRKSQIEDIPVEASHSIHDQRYVGKEQT